MIVATSEPMYITVNDGLRLLNLRHALCHSEFLSFFHLYYLDGVAFIAIDGNVGEFEELSVFCVASLTPISVIQLIVVLDKVNWNFGLARRRCENIFLITDCHGRIQTIIEICRYLRRWTCSIRRVRARRLLLAEVGGPRTLSAAGNRMHSNDTFAELG